MMYSGILDLFLIAQLSGLRQMKPALLVIDMLNEYLLPSGKIYCENCREIIPNIEKCIDTFRKSKNPVIFVNTAVSEGDVLVKKWGKHAMAGTKMAQVVDELSPRDSDIVVQKTGYDGFFSTNLDQELQSNEIDTVVLTGIHTHACVLLTGVGAFERGYNVITFEDCITTGYQANHETRLRFFRSHIGDLVESSKWMADNVSAS